MKYLKSLNTIFYPPNYSMKYCNDWPIVLFIHKFIFALNVSYYFQEITPNNLSFTKSVFL